MTREEFREAIVAALEHHSVGDLAEHLEVSLPTLDRWVRGRTSPSPNMRPRLVEFLEEL